MFSGAKKAEQANISFYTIMALFTVIMMADSDRIAELMNGALNIYKKKSELRKIKGGYRFMKKTIHNKR